MKYLSRVVWSEGMYMGPHHFQAQSRYFEDSIEFASSSLWFAPYGLIAAQIDEEALANGTAAVMHARGIFPDGLTFHMPESDPLPEARQVEDLFPVVRDKVTLLLAVPPHRPDGVNCAVSDNGTAKAATSRNGVQPRFSAETRLLHDETTGRDEKPVELGRKNIRLLLDTEDTSDLITLPVARIVRSATGRFALDPEFIPPCLDLAASPRLMSTLARLIDILSEKSSMFARRAGAAGSWAEFSTREIANFWLLHTINSALAPLRHRYLTVRGHPADLYEEMLRLAGSLYTFALEGHPRDLPLYDHDRLGECFPALDEHIRTHLETIVPTQFVPIPLRPVRPHFWEGEITDSRCVGKSRWILGIGSSAGEADVITRTPQLVKICSAQFVPKLVERALPAMSLTHLAVAPASIPAKVEHQYFALSKAGPCWDHMVQTRRVGVYVPSEIPDVSLELLVVIE